MARVERTALRRREADARPPRRAREAIGSDPLDVSTSSASVAAGAAILAE